MSDYPRTNRELYPADTRWGESIIPAPLGGVVDAKFLEELEENIASIKETISLFENKYPDFKWWETDFVDSRPAVSLLMQSVNPTTLVFPCFYDLGRLMNIVAAQIVDSPPVHSAMDVDATRIACIAIEQMPDGQAQLLECMGHMTPDDKGILAGLLSGHSLAFTDIE